MRTFFGIVIAVVIAAPIWWTFPIQAKQQHGFDSIDPFTMTGTVTNLLPEVHYDHGFIFPNSNNNLDPLGHWSPWLPMAPNANREAEKKMNKQMTPAEIELLQQNSRCGLARTNRRSAMSVKEKFIGTWKLLSWTIEQAGGELIDSSLGPNPAGWIMYQRDGRMSVNIMRSDRPKFASNNVTEATSEEIKSGFEGYFSYCGSYDVNVPKGFIIHHLELSAFPNWVGTDQKRYFEFSGDRLTLKTPPLTLSGRDQVHRLIWKRLS